MDHENLTPKCKTIGNGSCDYGVNCWFRHNEEMKYNQENHENDSVMQRILKLMEEMTKRMAQ